MDVIIEKSKAVGSLCAPPSKSMAHRLLICAALSKGISTVSNLAFSEDIKATISCLQSLGADIKIENDKATVKGINFKNLKDNNLFCNESGSTLRFLIPICALFDRKICLGGTDRLLQRSFSVYEDLFKSQGLLFEKEKNSITVQGRLHSGDYSVPGDVSSQFISGLLFALPLLEGDSVIKITGNIESNSYISLTIKALLQFGIKIDRVDEHTLHIKGNQNFISQNVGVEGDYSNAAFLDAFNLIGGNVQVNDLDENSVQGDKIYKTIFKELENENISVDISDCPDLGPVLMALGAAKNGITLTGTHRLKIKESDRGAAMALELSKFGIEVINYENSIIVKKGELQTPNSKLHSHNDHRIVMSLSILCSMVDGEISDAQAINKSFPNFFDEIQNLGIKIKVN
ncbi:MAG: 3-phosphoshikimate 1-carboxyvinyltransferase [Acutalibacteraceae bacterium]|nr:3-phosphoshikimate 1-carboxyvinyltransferase [Acutalibacteraceae bacterium]